MKYRNESVLVIDSGLFSCVAEKLAEDFQHVYYFTPWIEAFVRDSAMQLGAGVAGIERVDYWERVIDDVGLVVFPDCYFGPLQRLMERKLGKRVWGSRNAEELELLREEAKMHLAKQGIPIGDFAVMDGLDELEAYLKTHEDVHVKFSFTRGDLESFHSPNYRLVEPVLKDLRHRLGPRANKRTFLVEQKIKDAIEIGGDFYTIDGKYPSSGQWGIEVKGQAYVGRWQKFDQMPSQITDNLKRVAPTLEKYECRSWFGMETRVTKDGTPWVIDPLARFGNPPGALCCLMYTNMAEIMWEGSVGNMVEPIPAAPWGAQILMHSSWSERHWQPVYFPEKVAKYVKLVNHTVIDGVHYVIPGPDLNNAIGSVIGVGDTMEAAIEAAQKVADQVEGHQVQIEKDACPKALEEVGKLKQFGMSM